MAVTEANVASNELERVIPKLTTMFERQDTFFATIDKASNIEVVSNRDMRIPLELRPGGNFGHYDPDGGDLGLGSGPVFDKAVINTVHLRHAVQWTKKAEWATDNSRKAVVSTIRHLLATAMKEFRRNIDSLCMTAGDGVLATIGSVSSGGGTDTYTLNSDGYGAKLLRYGQPIAIMDSTLGTNRTTGTDQVLSYVDYANKIVKTAAVGGAVAGDKIVVAGLGNVTGTNVVSLKGVPYHNNSSTVGSWLGFTRSTTPEVLANRVAAGGALAPTHARLALNKIGDRVGTDNGNKPDAWMHPCQAQAYEELGQKVSIIQKQAKEEGLDLYFNDNMQMAGAPVRTSFSWDKTRIDFLTNSLWGRAEMHPIGFYELEGKRMFPIYGASGGIAASQIFYLVVSFNLFDRNPAAGSYIDTLSVPTGY